MYCPNCGTLLKDDAISCDRCGAGIEASSPKTRLAPGYARTIDSEPVLEALKKQNRITAVTSAVMIVLPLVVLLIFGAVSSSITMGASLAAGILISLIVAVIAAVSFMKKKLGRTFEGTVADKKHIRRSGVATRHGRRHSRNRWRLIIDCDDGKRRRRDASATVYQYLQIGDRIRYLPQFPQPFEKYDKSRDAEIPCMFCGVMNPVENETCGACRNPMVK